MIEHLWFVPLGFAASVLGSMIGGGGGIVIVPVLTVLGFPPSLAASNGLFAAVSNATASTISYSRQRRVEYGLGIKLGLASVPGTVVGASISADVTPAVFEAAFGFMLVASVTYMLLKGRLERTKRHLSGPGSAPMLAFAIFACLFAGIISAFFGVGGGVIFVPLMVAGMGIAMKRAAATSQLALLFASASGIIVHSALGHTDFAQAGLLMAGAFLGGATGARISARVREGFLLLLVSAVILVAAADLIISSYIHFGESGA